MSVEYSILETVYWSNIFSFLVGFESAPDVNLIE